MNILLAIIFAAVVSQESQPWKGFERTAIQYDRETDTFKGADLAGLAASMAFDDRMKIVDEILEEAGNNCRRIKAEAEALAATEALRPVFLLTADYDIVDALDRKNLTLVVPEWSFDKATRLVTCRVFTTSILRSPPICEARISTAMGGFVESVPCEWHGYGDPSKAVTVQVGDDAENTFECYELTFTLPESVNEMSVDFTQWGRIGDPETGFDVGNRQIRVNGEMTWTTMKDDLISSILSIGTVTAVDDEGKPIDLSPFEFFTDNGLTKATIKEENQE